MQMDRDILMLLHTKKYLTVFLGKQDLDKLTYLHSEGKRFTVDILTVFMGKIYIRFIYIHQFC